MLNANRRQRDSSQYVFVFKDLMMSHHAKYWGLLSFKINLYFKVEVTKGNYYVYFIV